MKNLILSESGLFEVFTSSPIFPVIIVVLVIGVCVAAWKKNKKEGTKKRRREEEVKTTIKKYLQEKENLNNVTIEFIEIQVRNNKNYRNRDVFDVLFEIRNQKQKNKIIGKKAVEIEGIATAEPHKDDPKDIVVHWRINEEFDYSAHEHFLKIQPKSKWKIYLRSLTKKNRSEYIAQEKQKLADWKKHELNILAKIEKLKLESEEKKEVFRPQVKKDK